MLDLHLFRKPPSPAPRSISLLPFLAAPIAGKLAERLPVRAFLGAGLLLVGVGLLLMSGIDPSDDWTILLAGFVVAGVGVGFIDPPLATAAVGVVEPRRRRRRRDQQHVPPGGHGGIAEATA
jgi:MFS family permease